MKAKNKNRLMDNHTVLGKQLPLDTPFVLLVDPSSLCNLRCSFCPSGNPILIKSTGRYQGNMSLDLFKKIIDDLHEFPKPIKVLRLYKEGEPLMNPSISEMIRYANDCTCVQRIDMTTNGVLLNPDLNRRLVDAGLDQINISVNKMTQGYVGNIRDLCMHKGGCEVYVKGIQEFMNIDEQKRFFELFGDIADKVFLEHLSPAWPEFKIERDFTVGHYNQPAKERKICVYPFYIMVINADGTVSSCVGDWKHHLLYGDVKKQSVRDIWVGTLHRLVCLDHLTGRRDNYSICKACLVTKFGTLEDIDDYAEEILERMKE